MNTDITDVCNANWQTGYIGCFKDTGYRVLSGEKKDFDPNSGDKCKSFCRKLGYRYAGTESGGDCFCGHDIRVKNPADNCNYKCKGNPTEICGGDWRISIYDTWDCATKPCKNGAACMDIDAGNYRCICTDEWTGRHCEHAVEGGQHPCKTVKTCRECPDLEILNGWVNDNKQVGSERHAEYSCKDGFTLKGNAIRTCQQNGKWGGEQPVCNKDVISSTSKQSSSSKTRKQMSTDTKEGIGSKVEDQSNKSAIITALSVVLALLGIVTVVLAVVVIKNRRQQKNGDQKRVYCEPDEFGMNCASPQLNTLPDINTEVEQNATKEQRSKPRTCNVTRKRNTPDMVNSDMKISDGKYVNNEGAILSAGTADDSYELLQHNQVSDSEYTTIDSRSTRLGIGQNTDVNYEMLDKNNVQRLEEDEYRKLNF